MIQVLKLIALVLTLYHFLGPWGSLAVIGVVAALGLGFYLFGNRLFEAFIHHQVSGLGKVMKDATVTIHSIVPALEPDPSVWRTGDDEEDDAFEADLEASGMPEGEFDWYKVDATIAPKPAENGTPAGWDPEMILLTKDDGESRHALELDIDCLKAQVELWEDDQFVASDYGNVQGPARVRLYIGVKPGTRDVRLCYLGEIFGRLRLPAPARVSA